MYIASSPCLASPSMYALTVTTVHDYEVNQKFNIMCVTRMYRVCTTLATKC